jgi:hypothetical protein
MDAPFKHGDRVRSNTSELCKVLTVDECNKEIDMSWVPSMLLPQFSAGEYLVSFVERFPPMRAAALVKVD